MYLKLTVLVLMTILGYAHGVKSLKHRRTTKPPLIEPSTLEAATTEKTRRYHYKPHHKYPSHQPSHQPSHYAPQYPHPTPKPPQYPPLSPSQYPPQYPPISSPQYPPLSPNPSHPPSPPHHTPAIIQPTPSITVLDQFDRRYPDGCYEFRYELPDETVRYERSFYISYHDKKILVVRGYYSYRHPDGRYFTSFFTADQNGYRQDSSYSTIRPVLPRTLNIEEDNEEDLRHSLSENNDYNQLDLKSA